MSKKSLVTMRERRKVIRNGELPASGVGWARLPRMKRALVGTLLGVGFIVALIVTTAHQVRVTCEVCIAYRGREKCEKAIAVDRAEALMQATSSVCRQLSGGVTDGIQCNQTRPLFTRCSE